MEIGNKIIAKYSFWDERINQKKAKNYQLFLHYSPENFSYCIFDRVTNEFLGLKSYQTHNFKKILVDNFFSWNFQSIKINIQANKSTIIPSSLFEKNVIEKYLYFNKEFNKKDITFFWDELKYMDAVIVYSLEKEIISFFQKNLKNVHIKSHSSIFIDSILRKASKSEENEIFIDLCENRFDIAVLKKSKLFLYNNFSFSSKNDFLYYVLNCYNTLNLNPKKDKIRIFGEFEKNEFKKPLKEYLEHVKLEGRLLEKSYSNIFNNMPNFYFHKIFNLTTCV